MNAEEFYVQWRKDDRARLRANLLFFGGVLSQHKTVTREELIAYGKVWGCILAGDKQGIPRWFYENIGCRKAEPHRFCWPSSEETVNGYNAYEKGTFASLVAWITGKFEIEFNHAAIHRIASLWGVHVKNRSKTMSQQSHTQVPLLPAPPKDETQTITTNQTGNTNVSNNNTYKAPVKYTWVDKEPEPKIAVEPVVFTGEEPVDQLFKILTSITCPMGYEDDLYEQSLTKIGFEKDGKGNWIALVKKQDGSDPRTMFAAHLDTVGPWKPVRVTHVDEGSMIKTDKTTILGADDKAGVVVLLHMFHAKVPGVYYLFMGEERGCKGSSLVAHQFKGLLDRCISFDRRGYDSIITYQSSQYSCSDEFANALAAQLRAATPRLNYKPDDTGSLTDSKQFRPYVGECTNLSVGYFNAHQTTEEQDIIFLETLVEAVKLVDWEALPTVRQPGEYKSAPTRTYSTYGTGFKGRGNNHQSNHTRTDEELLREYGYYGRYPAYGGDEWEHWDGGDDDKDIPAGGTGHNRSHSPSRFSRSFTESGEPIIGNVGESETEGDGLDMRFQVLIEMLNSEDWSPNLFAQWQNRYPNAAAELLYRIIMRDTRELEALVHLEEADRKFNPDKAATGVIK